jgi:MscS family membrane protein
MADSRTGAWRTHAARWACALVIGLSVPSLYAQIDGSRASPADAAAQAQTPKDALGRDSPRGTLLGFMAAARNGNDEAAALYLNTTLRGRAAATQAHELYVVLDSRLPARINQLSDRPEGSLANPLRPGEDVVGTISTANGPIDIVVERSERGTPAPVWLFSRKTLESIPDAFAEVNLVSVDLHLPDFLTKERIGGIRLSAWLALVLGLPLGYQLAGWLGLVAGPLVAFWRRRFNKPGKSFAPLPGILRLPVMVVAIRWLLSVLELPLLERQFWLAVATMLAVVSLTWFLLFLTRQGERYIGRRLQGSAAGELAAMLRLGRQAADVLIVAVGVLLALRYFGVNPTAALAGLGIGGIAVALAAQKTLENVIGGLSIIFDSAVRVGDFLKLGDTPGTVEHIGLRSTRIRTLDRTILSVPNGQVANMNVETMSARDKFWFHHYVGLRYETTTAQMRAVTEGIRGLLLDHRDVDVSSARVRFCRLGPFSLDLEVFAYIAAADWDVFLGTQEDLLLRILDVVAQSGATLALPSQAVQLLEAGPRTATARPDTSEALGARR